MLREILKLELFHQLKRISIWIYMGMFMIFSHGIIWMSLAGGGPLRRFTGAGAGAVHSNAPFALHFLIIGLTGISCLIAIALFGTAATRDFRENTQELLFTHPLTRTSYLLGRFTAASFIWLLIIFPVIIGAIIACLYPPVHPEKLGSVELLHFLQPLITGVLPMIIRSGLLYFGCALLFRRTSGATMAFLVQFSCYMAALSLVKTRALTMAAMLDPFGIIASRSSYSTQTLHEKNQLLITLSRDIVLNHVLWSIAGLAIFIMAWKRFSFGLAVKSQKSPLLKPSQNALPTSYSTTTEPPGTQSFTVPKQILHICTTTFLSILRSTPFITILSAGVLFMLFVGARNIGLTYDTRSLPLTSLVLDLTQQLFMLFIFIITAWLAADLVWRERNCNVHEITASTPVSPSVVVLGKLGALFLVQTLLMTLIMVTGMVIQISQGYTNFELGIYFTDLFILRLPIFVQLGVIVFFIHSLINNKLMGHLLVATYYVLQDFVYEWGFEHHLSNYAVILKQTHSSMNGFGPYFGRTVLLSTYWSAWACLLIIIIILTLPKELDTGLTLRIRSSMKRFTRTIRILTTCALIFILLTGSLTWHQTIHRHGFRFSSETREWQATFEERFKMYESIPHPSVTGLSIHVDLFPSERKVESRGILSLANNSSQPVDKFMVQFPQQSSVNSFKLSPEPHKQTHISEYNVVLFEFTPPILPGSVLEYSYDINVSINGIPDAVTELDKALISNGTFLDNRYLIPVIGYNREEELTDATRRLEFELPERKEFPPSDDPKARNGLIISPNAGFVTYEATVSTEIDQTALTSGELIRSWQRDNRNYFHYKMPSKSLLYFPVVSARYFIAKSKWRNIPVEIYYHPGHESNIKTMMDSAIRTLEYCSSHYLEYPFGVLRIAEYPRYSMTAESFPTLIPVSEGMGFISRTEPDRVNAISRLIAHEVAHQWFPHMIACAGTQGMYFLSETMAEHVALKVESQSNSQKEISEFIAIRIQDYFQMRGRYYEQEEPLSKTGFAYHVAYRKGMVVMNALSKLLGEENLEAALREYCTSFAFKGPDFTISSDMISIIQKHAPAEKMHLVSEMLETVSWFDNQIKKIHIKDGNDTSKDITVSFNVNRIQMMESGENMTVPVNMPITVAALDVSGYEICRETKWITGHQGEIILYISSDAAKPEKLVLDPDHLLLDKDLVDNVACL